MRTTKGQGSKVRQPIASNSEKQKTDTTQLAAALSKCYRSAEKDYIPGGISQGTNSLSFCSCISLHFMDRMALLFEKWANHSAGNIGP